jgi:hypothetical protein
MQVSLKETERHRDRNIKRQKDKETERLTDKNINRQKDKEIET